MQRIETVDIGLPKWPQMLVSGRPVTKEQASEIIRRTDTFFAYGGDSGNDREWAAEVCLATGYPRRPEWNSEDTDWQSYRAKLEDWKFRWGLITDTQYVHNTWIASAYIYGPYGWCHPDGQIGFVDNVGKWPSVSEIVSDWKILAEHFPFIEAFVTLMSGEHCQDDRQPLVNIVVKDGDAYCVSLEETSPWEIPVRGRTDDEFVFHLNRRDMGRECGLPREMILGWREQSSF